MFKIIKPGKKPDTTVTFECRNCGCVFTATDEDYETLFYSISTERSIISTNCPCCNGRINMDIDNGIKEKNHD